MAAQSVVIIGGYGQMGQLFMQMLQNAGVSVRAFGEADWPNAEILLSTADAILVCVPIAQTEQVIQQAARYLKPTAVLADLTSTKTQPLQTMLICHAGPVIGLHPVFGPTIARADSHVIVCCEGRELPQCQWLLDTFKRLKFEIVMMTAEQHDRAMDLIQGLQHFLTYCTGVFLQTQQASLPALLQIGTPLYRLQLQMLGRIFYQDAELYADIIASDASRLELLQQFITNSEKLLTQLQQGDRNQFITNFKAVTRWMGAFAKEGQDKTDELLNHQLL